MVKIIVKENDAGWMKDIFKKSTLLKIKKENIRCHEK